MNKIIILRGIQGSGKSTIAKKWVSEDPEHRIRWNNDDIRNMMGPYWVPARENTKILDRIKEAFIYNGMSKKLDIIIDDMNLNPKTVSQITDLVMKNNLELNLEYAIEFKDCFISVDECVRRDSLRTNPIGEKVIRDTWKRYRDMILRIENKKLYDNLNLQNKDLPHAIIVDLDATVALNITGRPFYGPGCAEGIKDDVPIEPVVNIVKNYPNKVIFVTGRDYSVENPTKEWIDKYIGIENYILLMRTPRDYSKGDISKRAIYENYIKDKYYIDFVLEDSQKVVDMYRSLGLTVLQPNEGKY